MHRYLRSCAFSAVGLAALLTLTSCSLLDPEPQPSPVSTKVVDPSMVAPSTEASTPAPATAAPGESAAPTDGATASPAPAPSASATTGTSRTTVTPFITSALWDTEGDLLDVEGIVPKIVEDDGTCTLVARKGETVRMVSQPAAPAASTTTCNPLQLPGSQLTAGTWTVTISYVSAHSTGVAAAKTVTVTK